jgi:hypothetical protein
MKKLSISVILIALILVITTSCSKQVYSGSFTGNDVQFITDYSILNGTKTSEMKLKEGTKINVVIESKSGNVNVLIADANGEKIYKGDNATSGKFSLTVPKTGTYIFSVTGHNAKGGVSFKVAD